MDLQALLCGSDKVFQKVQGLLVTKAKDLTLYDQRREQCSGGTGGLEAFG